ncbi:protein NLRC3-like [Boleophthalmus pectinirostris]|uniref:protein NLRC3-like n=1 Tax=Boleophthalmus pectinirostris TaxID=150288 RepID=UPI00242DB96D|nr:protein NLRC3-like [Boleophthalmus pectinirostris]
MRDELRRFCDVLSSESSVHVTEGGEERQRSSEAFLKITRFFLLQIGEEELAHRLHNQIHYPDVCRHKLKANLGRRYRSVYEGVAKAGQPTLLKNIYTELHITDGSTAEGESNTDLTHSPHTSITLHDIFPDSSHQSEPIRTVVMKGVAGAGKTLSTQKFCLDWAEGRAHQDIQLLFPLPFRELNVLRDTQFSLVGLVHHFFNETKKTRLQSFKSLKVLFILDGLDESQISLDFKRTKAVSDATESVSMDVLLVNLLRGNLLPSAHIWITTRPAAANQIPAECVSMVTEVNGFTNPQKDKYFSLKFKNQTQANAIISHVKGTRSLYMMCQIPVFCWILNTVLLHVLKTGTLQQLPQTLTEMYIHFLVVQTKLKRLKYDGHSQTDTAWSPETKKMVRSLGKLAFEQLQKGNLSFYDCDLNKCGLDTEAASVYSGVFTQVYREESGLYQEKVYCFVHPSVQEFLAALHVHQTFINSGTNLLSEEQTVSIRSVLFGNSSEKFYQTAVDKMLQSPSGDLDLFIRFLLGLSLPSNQNLLQGLVKHSGSSVKLPQKMAEYITQKLEEGLGPEKIMSLFHCLNELKERNLVEQIQARLSSGRPIRERLSQAQWSALLFILLSSDHLETFELKKYCASEEALLKLLPVVKASSTALLSSCDLTEKSCEVLGKMISSPDCALTDLDLSYNQLRDPGLKYLAQALTSPHCRLQRLRLAGCHVTEVGCLSLASALSSHQTHLTLLDLSQNHPGPSGVKKLSALQGAPGSRLESLILRPAGPQWLRPRIKYFTRLTLDHTTAYQCIKLSQNSTKASHVEQEQAYPDHTARFDKCPQLLCSEEVKERAYWEVEWSGPVVIAVSYRSLARKGNTATCGFGLGPDSWCLSCGQGTYTVTHKGKRLDLPYSSSSKGRTAVYVDFRAGSVSFYAESLEELVHLHTFTGTFIEPVVPGFRLLFGSTVRLCDLLEEEPSYV